MTRGFDNPETDDQAMQRRVQSLGTEQLTFAPDEDWSYSDWGFTILGTLVAEVSGQGYEEYIRDNLLQPLGMDNSGLMPDEIDPDLLASPHVHSELGEVIVSPVFPYTRRDAPAAMLHVSCEDLAKWALANLNRGELNRTRVLEPESFETMWEEHAATGIDEFIGPRYGASMKGYGLGHFVGSIDGHRLAGHGGVNPGFNAKIIYAPDNGIAVVGLANWMPAFGPLFPAEDTASDVLYELLGVEE